MEHILRGQNGKYSNEKVMFRYILLGRKGAHPCSPLSGISVLIKPFDKRSNPTMKLWHYQKEGWVDMP